MQDNQNNLKGKSASYSKKVARSIMNSYGLGWRLKLQVFICGAVVMALEISGSRILAPYFGSTVFVWGSLIGVVLTALALGYYLGGRMADRNPSYTIFCLMILSAGTLILIIPTISSFVFDLTISWNLGERYGPLLPTIVLMMLPSFLLGTISPYAIKLVAKDVAEIGNISGSLYSLSTVGSIAGTFITVFALIPQMGVVGILRLLGSILVFISLFGLKDRIRILLVMGILISTLFTPQLTITPNLALFKLAQNEVLLEKDTLYHHMVILEGFDPLHLGRVRTMILDDHLHSAMDLNDPDRIVYSYTYYFHIGFIFNPEITDVLFIGGGGFSGPKRFLSDYPTVNIDVVEIDSEVITAAKQYFQLRENERLRVYNEDGRMFLTKTQKKYDLIVLDAYSRSYVPFHLMTLEFFEEVASHLTPNGVVVSNLVSPLKGPSSRLLFAELNTIRQIFSQTYIFRAGRAFIGPVIDDATTQNLALVATESSQRLTKNQLMQRADENRRIRIVNFNKYIETLVEDNLDAAEMILTDDYAPVETLLNPLIGQPFEKTEIEYHPTIDFKILTTPIVLTILVAIIWLQYALTSKRAR